MNTEQVRAIRLGPVDSRFAEILREMGVVHLPDQPAQREAYLRRHGRHIEAVLVAGHRRVDSQLLDILPSVRAIVVHGVGYDNIAVDLTNKRGIGVSNTPDVLTECVADAAVGLLIDTVRKFSAAERFVRSGQWSTSSFPLTRHVSGSRVGILGLGRIGQAVAHRLLAFGCSIHYHNRNHVPGSPFAYRSTPVELAAAVDSLIVLTPGGNGTDRLVDKQVIDALGPDGVLINVSRGSVVDYDALITALIEGRLQGAGLDVYPEEPHVPTQLLALDNVVLLPHVGSATVRTRQAMADLAVANLRSALETGRLLTPVSESLGPPSV